MSTLLETGDYGSEASPGLDARKTPRESLGLAQVRDCSHGGPARSSTPGVPPSSIAGLHGSWAVRQQEGSGAQAILVDPYGPVGAKHQLSKSPPASSKIAAAHKLKSPASTKRLSFSSEMDDEDGSGESTTFSLAESTRKRFQTEKRQQMSQQLQAVPVQTFPPVKQPMEKCLGQIICGAAQARGLRPYMEDRQTFISSYTPLSFTSQPIPDDILRTFAAVYDGHNGAMAAEYASSRLHMLLAQDPALRWKEGAPGTTQSSFISSETAVREAKACAAVDQAIKKTFFTVDREILDRSRDENVRDGSTALVMLRMGNVLWTAHAGDSRAVLCRDGKAVRLTEDHKPELEKEKARVEANGGHVDFQRCWRVICPAQENRKASGLAVSRSLGDIDFKEPLRYVECEPDISRMRATPEDSFIVLASDGLWDVMKDEEAVTIVQEKLAATAARGQTKAVLDARSKEASQLLLDTALNKGSMDNITVLLLLLQWH